MTDDFAIQQTPETETRAISAPVSEGYKSLDVDGTKETYEELNSVLDKLAATVVQTLDQMIPYLAKMQSLLSQRGAARRKLLKKAGLPSWTKWVKAYAAKLDRSLRTVQERIRQFHAGRESGSHSGSARTGNRERVKLDTRQQVALVKAQLATSDLVAALEKGGDWESALEGYKKVAVSPKKLDGFVNAFNSEPDWKRAFTQLVGTLEKCCDALPAPAKTALTAAKRLLGGNLGTVSSARRMPEDGIETSGSMWKPPEKLATKDARKMPSPDEGTECSPVRATEEPPQQRPNLGTKAHAGIPLEKTSSLPVATSTKPYFVREQKGFGGSSIFAVVRGNNGMPWRTFGTQGEAETTCVTLNSAAKGVARLNATGAGPAGITGGNSQYLGAKTGCVVNQSPHPEILQNPLSL